MMLIGLITIISLLFSCYIIGRIIGRFSYSKVLPFYSVPVDNETLLTIGIIGDSWVSGQKLDSIIHNRLLYKGVDNKILSSGHPGAKSKMIYQNLFKENKEDHSSKFIIQNNPDYCIVIAGVNDTVGQVGPKFYSHHIEMILKTLIHYQIKPILVELPEFGIIERTDEISFKEKVKYKIYAKFTTSGEIDNIKIYRKYVDRILNTDNIKDSIIFIDFDLICNDYNKHKELYADSFHLSKKGKEKLGHLIVDELLKELKPAKSVYKNRIR